MSGKFQFPNQINNTKLKIMTSIEWLVKELFLEDTIYRYNLKVIQQAKEMHKQEIIDAWNGGDYAYFYSKETGRDFADGNDYYQETFVSKGSNDHISDISKMVELSQEEKQDKIQISRGKIHNQ